MYKASETLIHFSHLTPRHPLFSPSFLPTAASKVQLCVESRKCQEAECATHPGSGPHGAHRHCCGPLALLLQGPPTNAVGQEAKSDRPSTALHMVAPTGGTPCKQQLWAPLKHGRNVPPASGTWQKGSSDKPILGINFHWEVFIPCRRSLCRFTPPLQPSLHRKQGYLQEQEPASIRA